MVLRVLGASVLLFSFPPKTLEFEWRKLKVTKPELRRETCERKVSSFLRFVTLQDAYVVLETSLKVVPWKGEK